MKVLITTNLPSMYRVDFFNELGKTLDITVLYERRNAKNRASGWFGTKAENFKAVFLNGLNIGDDNSFCPGVIRYLWDKKFDLVVIGGYTTLTGILSILFMRLIRRPFVMDVDGGLINHNEAKLKTRIKRWLIGSADWWTSTGELTTDYLTYYGAKQNHVYVYPFTSVKAVDIASEIPDENNKQELRKKLGIQEQKMVLSVGQFIYRKGYDLLLLAARNIDKSAGVYIVGGEPTDEYRLLKDRYSLKQVHFVGFRKRENVAEYYKAADVFVLPTREDIWGLVINEAMAYGLPVITTEKCIAGVEMIVNDENGYIVPVEDADALWVKINALLFDETKTKRMGVNNIQKSRTYTIENMAARYEEIFRNILGSLSGDRT